MININDTDDTNNKINKLYDIFVSMRHPVINKVLNQLNSYEILSIRKILEVYSIT